MRITAVIRKWFTTHCVMPATNPAPSSAAALFPSSASTPANAAYAETFDRKWLETLKIVRNQPFLVRLATPSASPTAAAAAPIGPRVTDKPRLTKTDGDQTNVDPGSERTAYTAIRNVATDPAARVFHSWFHPTVSSEATATTTATTATDAT